MNYIEFLQESLITEASMNNLMVEALNEEGSILSKIKELAKSIVAQIKRIIDFIAKTVLSIIKKAVGILRKKKPTSDEKSEPKGLGGSQPKAIAAPKEYEVPKAIGFANDVTNNLNKGKIISLCHSKNDRKEEIKQKQDMIIERCVNARNSDMVRKVGIQEFERLKTKSAQDIDRAYTHINGIKSALKTLDDEFSDNYFNNEFNVSEDEKKALHNKCINTITSLRMISAVLAEFSKTVAWQTNMFARQL